MASRKDEIKQKAKAEREARQKREKRSRLKFQLGIVGVAVAALTAITIVLVSATGSSSLTPANMAGGGVRFANSSLTAVSSPAKDEFNIKTEPLSTDKTDVRIYIDYMCPFCGQFEQAYGDYLSGLVASGDIDLEYHPISILDRSSAGTKYSTRAAGASACVAESAPEQWLSFNQLMFDNQPEEGLAGLTNEEIKGLVSEANADNQDVISSCIDDNKYTGWAGKVTDAATEKLPFTDAGLAATPSVIVNGELFSSDDGEFQAYLDSVING